MQITKSRPQKPLIKILGITNPNKLNFTNFTYSKMEMTENFSELLTFGSIIYLEEENIKGKAMFSEGFSNSELKLRVYL